MDNDTDKTEELCTDLSRAFTMYRLRYLQDTPGIWTDRDVWDQMIEEIETHREQIIKTVAVTG